MLPGFFGVLQGLSWGRVESLSDEKEGFKKLVKAVIGELEKEQSVYIRIGKEIYNESDSDRLPFKPPPEEWEPE